jgi:hypothetical protein
VLWSESSMSSIKPPKGMPCHWEVRQRLRTGVRRTRCVTSDGRHRARRSRLRQLTRRSRATAGRRQGRNRAPRR